MTDKAQRHGQLTETWKGSDTWTSHRNLNEAHRHGQVTELKQGTET